MKNFAVELSSLEPEALCTNGYQLGSMPLYIYSNFTFVSCLSDVGVAALLKVLHTWLSYRVFIYATNINHRCDSS
jgi:hypothetical protein